MSSYIGKVQIGSGDYILIGSTLYGECDTQAATAAKTVTLNSFDTVMNGVTIHVRFNNGNSATSGITLAVNTTGAINVRGNCVCEENEIVAFTYKQEEVSNVVQEYWQAERSVKIETANNILTKIDGQEVNVATKTYVDNKTGGLSGLTGAMHFRGITTTTMTDGRTTAVVTINNQSYTPESGDVVIYNNQEYVWVETDETNHTGYWELLGDEGSYLLASAVEETSVLNGVTLTAGTTPPVITLDTNATTVLTGISNASGDNAARAASAEVTGGILKITTGILQTFSSSSVTGVTSVTAGTAPSLTPNTINVLKNKTVNSGT